MVRRLCSLLFVFSLITLVAAGCAPTKRFTITTQPPGALVTIDGQRRGPSPVNATLPFADDGVQHTVAVSSPGYADRIVMLTTSSEPGVVNVPLQMRTQQGRVLVSPPAIGVLDDQPLSATPSTTIDFLVPFEPDELGNPLEHTLVIRRDHFEPVTLKVKFGDTLAERITLQPSPRPLSVESNPPGAIVSVDGQELGTTPLELSAVPFKADMETGNFSPVTVALNAPLYAKHEQSLSIDGPAALRIEMPVLTKTAAITVTPADAALTVGGERVPVIDGKASVPLRFPPRNGALPVYNLQASLSRPGERWADAKSSIGWDNGESAYSITLEEILERPVKLESFALNFADNQWTVQRSLENRMAYKAVDDTAEHSAKRVTDLPAGTQVLGLAISPLGDRLAVVTAEQDESDLHAKLLVVDAANGKTLRTVDDGALMLDPSFTPAGDAVLLVSDRGGDGLQVWSLPVDGSRGGFTRNTAGPSQKRFPLLDANADARMYYLSHVPGRRVPTLMSAKPGTVIETELLSQRIAGVTLSPDNQQLAVTSDQELLTIPSNGGEAKPAVDGHLRGSASYRLDSNTLAFAIAPSDTANTDIQTLGSDDVLARPTANAADDDLPAFDPLGRKLYFRSSRGGKWDVWVIDVAAK